MNSSARPLPENPYHALNEKRWHDAYDQCLQILPFSTDNRDKDLVYARILGYLILEAPTSASRDYVSQEILDSRGDKKKLNSFAELFMSNTISAFKDRCSTPEMGLEGIAEFFDLPINKKPRDHISAKRAALYRDNYRCIVKHTYDLDYRDFVLTGSEQEELDKEKSTFGTETIAWHIIPPLSAPDSVSLDRASQFLLSFCSISFDELKTAAHGLTNILTLGPQVGILLCHFRFKAIPNFKNSYTLHSWRPGFLLDLPSEVTFSTKTKLPLPNPRYLEMHAAICRVAQWSGAAQRAVFLKYSDMVEAGREDEAHQ